MGFAPGKNVRSRGARLTGGINGLGFRVRGFERFRLSPVEVGAVWVAASSRAVFIVIVSPSPKSINRKPTTTEDST